MQELFIDTPEQLQELAAELAASDWLAVDTEFIRERTYLPRLCLIQICDGRTAACIDPLALKDLAPLKTLLLDPNIVKVFHAARQDQEIFLNEWGELPSPVFDTQPAAALLGLGDQVGYGNLIQQLLKVELAKDHSRTDWSRRPLEKAQLRYALDDVIYLGQAYLKIHRQLEKLGRLEWLEPEFETLVSPATYALEPMTMWQRVKGRQHLRGVRLAVLQALAAWREEQALARNLPRRWVLKDEVLLEMARRSPKTLAELGGIRGLEPGVIRNHGETLLQLIAEASQRPKSDWPVEKARPKRLTAQEEATVDLLSSALRLIADQAGLSPQAIASRKDLQALLQTPEQAILLKGWRRKLAGEPLQQLLSGHHQIVIDDGIPALTTR